jgi:hypothetical protein
MWRVPPSAYNLPAPRIRIGAANATALAATAVALAAAAMLAGCDRPAGVAGAPAPTASTTAGAGTAPPSRFPTAPAAATRTPTPGGTSSPVFGELTAQPCQGHPSGEQVIALLRRTTGLLPTSGTVAVRTGPLCAGSWQYTVLTVADRDPLQVVTKGSPQALELVTAGTDVCTIEVRVVAPVGIRTITRC